jgi:hypothetical protein
MSRLEDVIRRGTTAARPAASAVAVGTLYFATDGGAGSLGELQRSNGTTWDSMESGGVSVANTAAARVYAYLTFRTAR